MNYRLSMTAVLIAVCLAMTARAQDNDANDREQLKIAALEALMSAPPEVALPRVTRVLQSENSDEVKESALFILSQIETPEAQALLLDTARQADGELQEEAITMIGIGGDPEALAGLREIYAAGDEDVREAVLEAYLIADDSGSIYELAVAADNEEDFEAAVEMLGAMRAADDLRNLLTERGVSEGLIEAYAIAGDVDTLQQQQVAVGAIVVGCRYRQGPVADVLRVGAAGVLIRCAEINAATSNVDEVVDCGSLQTASQTNRQGCRIGIPGTWRTAARKCIVDNK